MEGCELAVQRFFAEGGYYCVCGLGHYLSKQPELPCQAVILTVSLPDWPQASTWITTRTKVGAASGIIASFFFFACFANCYKKQWRRSVWAKEQDSQYNRKNSVLAQDSSALYHVETNLIISAKVF